ncbi:unnamed protein product [Boreogadus saida]
MPAAGPGTACRMAGLPLAAVARRLTRLAAAAAARWPWRCQHHSEENMWFIGGDELQGQQPDRFGLAG